MKVIKYGKRTQFPMRTRCPDCSAVLDVEENDIYKKMVGFNQAREPRLFVACPVCSREFEVRVDKITERHIMYGRKK